MATRVRVYEKDGRTPAFPLCHLQVSDGERIPYTHKDGTNDPIIMLAPPQDGLMRAV